MEKGLIVITGASSGIGKQAAIEFSKKGYPLLLLARRIEKLEGLNLSNCICKKVDVTDLDLFEKAVKEAEKKFGRVDCLINNAGVMLLGKMDEQDPSEWQQMLDVNIKGVLNGINVVLKNMIKNKTGTIINISSIAGRKTFPNHAAYCATKFAVHALTENLREEIALHNVRAIIIAPGAVETELLSHTTSSSIKEDYNKWKESMGNVLSPLDIVNAILYAYEQPQHVCVREIVIAATKQQP